MKTDQYLTKDIFLSFLENDFFDESYTFIICDIEWLKIFDVMKFINVHKFIFISNDFRKNINIIKHLEIVVFVNDDILFEILDIDKLTSYIENKLNYSLTNEDIKSYIEDSNLDLVIKINEILKKFNFLLIWCFALISYPCELKQKLITKLLNICFALISYPCELKLLYCLNEIMQRFALISYPCELKRFNFGTLLKSSFALISYPCELKLLYCQGGRVQRFALISYPCELKHNIGD